MKIINLQIASKDRHTELALLLQSLRTQTYQNWNICILDESQTPIMQNNFIPHLINMIKLEGHCVNIIPNDLRLGVCHARNMLIEKDYFPEDGDYVGRLDDDVILESDYLEKMIEVLNSGYDIASGITPNAGQPLIKRKINKVKHLINKKFFDKEGNLIKQNDDCGMGYLTRRIIPSHEFRSNAIMKKEVVEKVKYPNNLSPVGFREEGFFSTSSIYAGFKIGVHTQAIAYHLRTPSGGCRFPDYQQKVISDDKYFKKWLKREVKKRGNPFET